MSRLWKYASISVLTWLYGPNIWRIWWADQCSYRLVTRSFTAENTFRKMFSSEILISVPEDFGLFANNKEFFSEAASICQFRKLLIHILYDNSDVFRVFLYFNALKINGVEYNSTAFLFKLNVIGNKRICSSSRI